jgi:hypothetical protein
MSKKFLCCLMLFMTVSLGSGLSAEAEKITANIWSYNIAFLAPANKISLSFALFDNLRTFQAMRTFEPKLAWESKQVSETVYHLRIPGVQDRFLKLDTSIGKISVVSGGTFGKTGGQESTLENASFIGRPPFLPPAPPGFFEIELNGPTLEYDSDTNDISIMCDGFRIIGKEELEIVKAGEGIYHVRLRAFHNPKDAEDRFLKINAITKKMIFVRGKFGENGGDETKLLPDVVVQGGKYAVKDTAVHADSGTQDAAVKDTAVHADSGTQGAAVNDTAVHADLGTQGALGDIERTSAWLDAERDFFQDILSKQQFDILVVPVQVQDNGFDHIERSLMTKYLVSRIRRVTKSHVPDPDLVERALGRGLRTFSEQRMYRLANALGVKTLIRVYAGHNRNMKMRLTLVAQERPANGVFDTAVKSRAVVIKDIPFSDEHLPSEAFAERFVSVMTALGIEETRKDISDRVDTLRSTRVPSGPTEMAGGKEQSPLTQAAHLCIFGAFSPPDTKTSFEFYERALSILRGIPNSSPDGDFLKAYAYANLYRRPAAVEVLKSSSTAEQAALRSYLDGDLVALPSQVEKIRNPIPKLLMQVALADLRWAYDDNTAKAFKTKFLQDVGTGWALLGVRRYTVADPWDIPNNAELKQFLDNSFPIKGYSLNDIALGMAVSGDYSTNDTIKIDASIQEHRKRVVEEQPIAYVSGEKSSITRLDLLDLAAAWAEQTILKSISLRSFVQGLPEQGISLIEKYETIYGGTPELLTDKYFSMLTLARQKPGIEGMNIGRSAGEASRDACLAYQGQYRWTGSVCTAGMAYYNNDFPRRPFWRLDEGPDSGDRAQYQLREIVVRSPDLTAPHVNIFKMSRLRDRDIDLQYTVNDPRVLEQYYKDLNFFHMHPDADILVEHNKERFKGSPVKSELMAEYYKKKGDEQSAAKVYEDAIPVTPRVWQPYYELGLHLLRQGDVFRAKETFERYPLFQDKSKADMGDSLDTVALSNEAYSAGIALHTAGAIQDARPFFELSAGYQTGSARGMKSEYELAMYDGNFKRAAQAALERGSRYVDKNAYADYLRLLRIVGNAPEWESLFFNLNMMSDNFINWSPVLTALRMEGRSDEDVRAWLAKNGSGKVGRNMAQLYYSRAFLVDRKPDPALPDMIQHIEKQVSLPESQRGASVMSNLRGLQTDMLTLYAGARNALMMKQYDKAYDMLEPWTTRARGIDNQGDPILPYIVWSGMKAGRKEVVEKLLITHRYFESMDFDYWLSTAMMQAAEQHHRDALKSFDLARTNIISALIDTRPVPAWYQLVETCELLFKETGENAYRDRVVELARLYQQIQPLDSWAYAVEAKYSKDEDSRTRALALTLYLDPKSFHIADCSEKDKERALKWLDMHNPFLQKEGVINNKQI